MVGKYVYAGAFPERATHAPRKGQLGSYLPNVDRRVQEGCDNASLLWREIQDQGFSKGYKVVDTLARVTICSNSGDTPLSKSCLAGKNSCLT